MRRDVGVDRNDAVGKRQRDPLARFVREPIAFQQAVHLVVFVAFIVHPLHTRQAQELRQNANSKRSISADGRLAADGPANGSEMAERVAAKRRVSDPPSVTAALLMVRLGAQHGQEIDRTALELTRLTSPTGRSPISSMPTNSSEKSSG